ncbi:helix-turn-helix transcriptional regulator [Streptacidiphilus jiangxiensis]|nr:LuxR C-terminal-related transcriptional regulator [Streptacidiphilus jiangxiensis]
MLPLELNPSVVAVYHHVLLDGSFRFDSAAAATGLDHEELTVCRDTLLACELLQRAEDTDQLVPVNPELAAARLSKPVEATIRSYRRAVELTRESLLQLMPAYLDRTTTAPAGGLEIVQDPAEVQLLVNQAVDRCTTELLTVQPGGHRPPELLQEVLSREVTALRRGAEIRILYQHTVRTQLSVHSYVSSMIEAGALIRTADQLAERMIIVDREIAFINRRRPGQAPGAVVVREPVLVSFMRAHFEQFWISAAPFDPNGPGYQNVSDDLKRSLLELLAQGLKDEVVARRLGMSVRTCRRHIAALMQELGADSRFEAGVRAAQLGLLKTSTA